jgi:antibiotic biosynthesis monooxygenase
MYAAIRRYNIYEGTNDQFVRRVNEGFVPLISKMPGFVAYYFLDAGEGAVVSVSVFEDRQGADESTHIASEWVRKNVASLIKTSPVIVTGQVKAHAERAAQATSPGASADRRPSAATAQGVNPAEARR